MWDNLNWWQKLIAAVIAGLVVGVPIWLTEFDGWQTLKHWWSRPRLLVSSMERPNATEVLSGEKTNIHFDRGVSGRVVWLFDEKESFLGWDQVQHAFVNDRSQLTVGQSHRIDAFFRRGATYETVNRIIEVAPAPRFRVAVQVQGAHVQVITSARAGNYWHLDGVTLASYADGRFIEMTPLKIGKLIVTGSRDTSARWSSDTSTVLSATDLHWYADTTDFWRSVRTGPAWTAYGFHGERGEPLILMQPLVANVRDSLHLRPR